MANEPAHAASPSPPPSAAPDEGFEGSLPGRTQSMEQAFLQDIIENPEDDSPRLIYADWLDEHGQDDRAEFIRLQCSLAQMVEENPRRIEMTAREKELLTAHGAEWAAPLQELVSTYTFARGFVGAVKVSAEVFLERGNELFHLAPVTQLGIHRLTDTAARTLGTSPHFAHLTSLNLGGNHLTDGGAEALTASPNLAQLTALDLTGNHLTDGGVRAIATSPNLRRLTTLNLGWTQLTDGGAEALAASPNLAQLTALDLTGNHLTDGGVRALAASPHLTKLTTLNLTGNQLTDEGVEVLAASHCLGNLTTVNLTANRLTDAGRRALRQRFGYKRGLRP